MIWYAAVDSSSKNYSFLKIDNVSKTQVEFQPWHVWRLYNIRR